MRKKFKLETQLSVFQSTQSQLSDLVKVSNFIELDCSTLAGISFSLFNVTAWFAIDLFRALGDFFERETYAKLEIENCVKCARERGERRGEMAIMMKISRVERTLNTLTKVAAVAIDIVSRARRFFLLSVFSRKPPSRYSTYFFFNLRYHRASGTGQFKCSQMCENYCTKLQVSNKYSILNVAGFFFAARSSEDRVFAFSPGKSQWCMRLFSSSGLFRRLYRPT